MIKRLLAKVFAMYVYFKNRKWMIRPLQTQQKVFEYLIKQGTVTKFGKDHHFDKITSYQDFCQKVPISSYEDLKPYIELIREGQENILWKGKPIYFAKTSGTTSGVKYIPITKESIKYHINAARDAILHYIHDTVRANFVTGKMIFLQGSPILREEKGIKIGRLSGIVAHYVPKYLQKNRMPSWETNCIENWETKVDEIISETTKENMTVIGGIPSWVQMYFSKMLEQSSKNKIIDIFPNLELFIYGGVNFKPYEVQFKELIGKKINSIELFPASEGFFAFQDKQNEEGMLLLLNSAIFYEFIPLNELDKGKTISLKDVKVGENYVMLISSNAGLWRYNLGDTVMFTSTTPYRLVVSGRVKHFISAFGEHVIAKEVELAMKEAIDIHKVSINEFTVAPQVNPKEEEGLPYHEWFVEFEILPKDISAFAKTLDNSLQRQNIYYKDLLEGKILQCLKVRPVIKDTFNKYMKHIGKLGGQNKVQRLSNHRKMVDTVFFNCYSKQ